ncbi:DUF2797 domain-containing protein [Actinacidiphila yeochonensis]|uniref:DUF2797 domain-containing protein n=1 Tax=Actinacidiphila yeochonensis TaxID=89050 RepID=UPI000A5D8DA2|nr:DUF2797 domain-containing protein [Actinacidiphila yeochonensis]
MLDARARRDQCEPCAALDRSASVAADTVPGDPRPYAVYLASFGVGLHKVGITSAARGGLRLLEQAAVCSAFLGEGPLMTARRTEAVLGAALRLPDRVRDTAKRAARHQLPPTAERRAELAALYAEAAGLRDRLPEALRLRPFQYDDHTASFGLDADPPPSAPASAISELVPGGALVGTVTVAAGHDLVVDAPSGAVLLDTRLTCGWPLARSSSSPGAPFPSTPAPRSTPPPQPLF